VPTSLPKASRGPTSTLGTDAEGRAVIVRRATDPAGRQALRDEAAAHREARHPGVVEVVSFDEQADEATLVLLHCGNRPLRSAAPLTVAETAGVVAALAGIVADLHARGIVHGTIDADQVVLGAEGRPVLGGFGRNSGAAPAPDDDVAALGSLLHDLLPTGPGGSADGATFELIPHRRPWWPRLDADGARRAVQNLADLALADDPASRPSARRLAEELLSTVPEARMLCDTRDGRDHTRSTAGGRHAANGPGPHRDGATGHQPTGPSAPRRRVLLGAVALLGAALLALGVQGLRAEPTPGAATEPPPVAAARPDAPPPGSAAPATDPACGVATCTTVSDTGTVQHAGRRFAVGAPGDEAVVGDWNCDGEATALVLRPATGEVYAFTAWAGPGHDVPPAGTGQVPSGAHLLAAPVDADGCALPLVRSPDGRTLVAPIPGELP
jgi:hypothetical protein